MEGTLKVSSEQLISTASEFENKGTTVANLTNEMMNIVTGLAGVWEGEAATTYINRFKELSDDILKMNNMIKEHVTDLNEMANVYQQAERANEEIATGLRGDVIS